MWRCSLVLLAACGRLAFEDTPDDAGLEPDADEGGGSAFRDLCGFGRMTIVENGIALDDGVGAVLADAVAARCATSPMTRTVSQDDPGILDPATDRPLLAPDDLAVIGGGDGPHRAIAYLLRGDTPVIWSGSSTATYRERATGRVIATGPTSATHDYALVMVVTEPIGGARILSAQGMTGNGTVAAGYWFQTALAPGIATNGATWTLVEWTNADGDPAPSAGDSFVVIAAG